MVFEKNNPIFIDSHNNNNNNSNIELQQCCEKTLILYICKETNLANRLFIFISNKKIFSMNMKLLDFFINNLLMNGCMHQKISHWTIKERINIQRLIKSQVTKTNHDNGNDNNFHKKVIYFWDNIFFLIKFPEDSLPIYYKLKYCLSAKEWILFCFKMRSIKSLKNLYHYCYDTINTILKHINFHEIEIRTMDLIYNEFMH